MRLEWTHNITQSHTHNISRLFEYTQIDESHISPSGTVVNVGATEVAGLCATLDVIGSRDLIGAVHVEGESIRHTHNHQMCVFIYLCCVCVCVRCFQTCM